MKETPLPSFSVQTYHQQLLAWNVSFGGATFPVTSVKNVVGKNVGTMFGIGLLLLIAASVMPSVANATTGITLPHSRFNNATITFTPNPNITVTPGYVPLIQVVPLVFAGIALGYGLDGLAGVL